MARRVSAAPPLIKSELHIHLTPDDTLAACVAAGHVWRQRVRDPTVAVHALLLQILHATAMIGVSRLVGVPFTRVTTLLDAEAYPAAELTVLYHRRWQAGVNLRHLKQTLGMRVLRSQSSDGVERELLEGRSA